jgi:hypothetical protein
MGARESSFRVMAQPETIVYRSPNGDDWLLDTGESGTVFVIHRPNKSSGGRESRTPVEEFLERHPGSPESEAVTKALERMGAAIQRD